MNYIDGDLTILLSMRGRTKFVPCNAYSLLVMSHGGDGANLSFSKSEFVMGTKINKSNLFLWSSMKAEVSNGRRFGLSVEAKIREIFMPALSSTMTKGNDVSWIKSKGECSQRERAWWLSIRTRPTWMSRYSTTGS